MPKGKGPVDFIYPPKQITIPDALQGNDGQAQSTLLRNRKRREKTQARATATCTIAGGNGLAIRNRGRLSALLGRLIYDEAGVQFLNADVRNLQARGELLAQRRLPSIALPSADAQVAPMLESFPIYFAKANTIDDGETKMLDPVPPTGTAAPALNLSFFPNRGVGLPGIVGGLPAAGTAVLTGLAITLVDICDEDVEVLPDYQIYQDETTKQILQADPALEFPVNTQDKLADLLFQCDSSIGEVPDIVTTIGLRDDDRWYIEPIPWLDALDLLPHEGYADALADSQAYMFFDFVRKARLSTMLDASRSVNLRFILNCQPSPSAIAAGGGGSVVRLLRTRYRQMSGRTAQQTSHQQALAGSQAKKTSKAVAAA